MSKERIVFWVMVVAQLPEQLLLTPVVRGCVYGSGCVLGNSCGSVGRLVASDTRGPWFKSSLRQI